MPPARFRNALMNAPRAAADVLLELVSQLFDVYLGTHREPEHNLLGQLVRHRMARVAAQVDREDIEIAFGHRDIVSATNMPGDIRSVPRPQASWHLVCSEWPLREPALNCDLALERRVAGIKAHYQLGKYVALPTCHLLILRPGDS
jgi:hypothetical protein